MRPAAILDVDRTLVDTNYHHAVAWYRAFRQHGVVLPLWRIHRHAPDLVAPPSRRPGAKRRQGLRPRRDGDTVMLGDSTWDCESARRAGVPTVGVLTGGSSEQELLDAGAGCVFGSRTELRGELARTPFSPG